MTAPEFSVVVPVYNSGESIDLTLRSVLGQSRRDLELIVVDDGSTDGTSERVERLIEADPKARLIRQRNRGTAGARNTGIAEARAPLVAFLDHDDLWMPGYLDGMSSALAAAPDAGMAYTDAWLFDDDRRSVRRMTSFEHYQTIPADAGPAELLERLVEVNFIMSSTTVRASVLAELGGFDENIQGADDWDLWLRIAATGYRAVPAQGCLMVQRDHSASQSKDLAMMFANMEAVLGKVAANPEVAASARERARSLIAVARRQRRQSEAGGAFTLLRALRAWRRRLLDVLTAQRVWRDELPAEVAAAFPELASNGTPRASSSAW